MKPPPRSAHGLAIAILLLLAAAPPRAQAGRTHDLPLRPENVHWGYYDASVKPVLRIASGDTVRVETAAFARGVTLRLAPFFGSIGVALHPLLGRVSSGPPGAHAGNLDNKELVAGSTLYVPVHVPGALLSMGDGHALQGDGEVTLTALETSLRGTVRIAVRKGISLKWPRAETPTHYIAMGLHTDLDEAARLATREMIDFLVTEKRMNRDEAYILCSVAADLHVTQLVDGTKGVHAMLAKSMFAR